MRYREIGVGEIRAMEANKHHFNAKWIWLDYITPWGISGSYRFERIVGVLPTEKNRWGLFRKSFEIDPNQLNEITTKRDAMLYISVDSRYKCFINGMYVGRGIYRCNKNNWYFDEYNISSFLKAGKNTIAILATFFGDDMSWYEPMPHGLMRAKGMGKGGLIFEISYTNQDQEIKIKSDSSVKSMICDAWDQTAPRMNVGLPYMEIFDNTKWHDEWLSPEYDDSDRHIWGHTLELDTSVALPNLVPCDIPRIAEEQIKITKVVSAGVIQPYFSEEEIQESQHNGDEPIDFTIQLAQSTFKQIDTTKLNWTGLDNLEITLSATPKEMYGIVFDLTKIRTGFLNFDIETQDPDVLVSIVWGEKLDEKRNNWLPDTHAWHAKYGMQFKAKLGINHYERFHWNGFRYVLFVFQQIKGNGGKIRIRRVGINQYLYPLHEKGQFECNEPKINALFEACKWTMRSCMHDGYEDCPSREQRQWVGDAYVESMVNYAIFGDTALVRKLIRQVGQSQRGDGLTEMATPGDSHVHGLIIPDYCFYWISIIYQYYRYTGDKQIVKEQFPMVIRAIRWFLEYMDPSTHLISNLPYWIFIDWSTNDKWGACGPVNAQFYMVLKQVLELADIIRWEDSVQEWITIPYQMKLSLQRYFWNEQRSAYIDAVEFDEKGQIIRKSEKVSFHMNSLMLLYELAPLFDQNRIFKAVFDQPYSSIFVQNRNPIWTNKTPKTLNEKEHIIMAEPYFFHHVNQCFAKFGRFDLLMQYFKDGWIQMLERGGTTIWETWGDQRSLCHAWCTTPAYDLMTHCLGVKISEPGAQKIHISPNLCGLSWVKGSVPTNLGNVNVEWNWNESLKQLTIQYDAPRIIGVEFKAPIINGQLPETYESPQPNKILCKYKN